MMGNGIRRLMVGALGGLLLATAATTASAQEYDLSVQQCIQFNGTILGPGEFVTVWPTEFYGATGYYTPSAATGTLQHGYPWPCGPTPPPAPEPPPPAEPFTAPIVEAAVVAEAPERTDVDADTGGPAQAVRIGGLDRGELAQAMFELAS